MLIRKVYLTTTSDDNLVIKSLRDEISTNETGENFEIIGFRRKSQGVDLAKNAFFIDNSSGFLITNFELVL